MAKRPAVIDLDLEMDEERPAALAPEQDRSAARQEPVVAGGGSAARRRPVQASPHGKAAAAQQPHAPIDLCSEELDDAAVCLVIDLLEDEDCAPADVIDLTADDASLAKQMQRAFNAAIDLTASDGTDEMDLLLAYRTGVDRFLSEHAVQYGFRVREVVHNKHSRPGTPLYSRFYDAYRKCRDKSIKLVFHGTSERNIAAILEKSLDPTKRGQNGQALGSGEYFAEDPIISLPYMKGGRKILVFAVIMDKSGLRAHNSQGILVCHNPSHHLPLAVVTLDNHSHLASAQAMAGLLPPQGNLGMPGASFMRNAAAQLATMIGRAPWLQPMPAPRPAPVRAPRAKKGRWRKRR
ncbi:hypothetical protein KFE25_009347 [Diacronema lutheri]|uniref:PARP catalytic domain-containing protein n=1 Tax=Diacronema lutheri TaxID=2081491 RepID=A0A8J5XXN0_DIALT|nr:hypothetical protein KFE25_009347 [Diacronema lutheri]